MSERGTIEVAVAEVIEDKGNNNNNNNNNNNTDDGDDADHLAYHSGLLTIGEKCVHLICEFVRTFRTQEKTILSTLFAIGAISLSRLSRTCRALYIYVRNLPSVLELPQPPFSTHLLPWGTIGLDLGYWGDIAGLVWEVRDPRQLLSLTAPRELREKTSNQDIKQSEVQLRQLFFHVPNLTGYKSLNVAECTEFLRILEHCGGLCFSVHDKFDLIASVGLDLRRCKNLRYLHVSVDLRKRSGYESYEPILDQLSAIEVKPQYASIAISRAEMLTDLSALSSFQCIAANGPADLSSLEGAQQIRSVSFENLRLTDVGALAHVHTVELSECNTITDVSALGNVHSLTLKSCRSITDVSSLCRVPELRLFCCHGITDVSALSAVHKLDIRFCYGVTNLDTLPNLSRDEEAAFDLSGDLSDVRSVDVSYRDDVTDVSMLGHVHTLNLAVCKNITDVSMLGNVHTLNLKLCTVLTDVSTFSRVHSLNLSYCKNVTDVSALRHVHTLDLMGCSGVTDVSALGSVHTLSLAWCDSLTDVSALGTVCCLNLSCCKGVRDVSALHSVTYLRLVRCRRVTNASTLINRVPYLVY